MKKKPSSRGGDISSSPNHAGAGEFEALRRELEETRVRLAEAEETLLAIRKGEVDALVVESPQGERVFTLQGAETTYRFLVEEMSEGALLLGTDGTILYANNRFAALVQEPLERVVGRPWQDFFMPADSARLAGMLAGASTTAKWEELPLRSGAGGSRPAGVSVCSMRREQVRGFSVVVTDLSERKAAEAELRKANESLEARVEERTVELRESEERALLAVDTAGLGTYERDLRTNRINMNAVCRDILGCGEENLPPDIAPKSLHPEDAERILAVVERAFDPVRREICAGEFRILRPDGSLRWVSGRGRVLFDDSTQPGTPRKFVGVLSDITERKHAQDALRESEERLRLVLEGVCAGVWEVRMETGELYWSPEYRQLYSFGAEEPPSEERWAKRVHPEDLARLKNRVRREIEEGGGSGWRQEFRMQHPTLGERWIESLVRVRRDAAGRAVSYSGIDLDVTERKHAEEALRESEARLAQAVAVGELGTFEHDHTSGVIKASRELRAIYGFDKGEELSFGSFVERYAPEERQRVTDGIKRSHEPTGDGRYEAEHRIEVPGKGTRWVSVRAQTFFEGEGGARRKVRTIGAAQDITERKAFEAELQRLVDERTAKLQELVGELEHFSYTITHDLKAPLRAMRGFAEIASMLCGECARTEAKEAMARISTSAERMECLITDALNYSRAVRQELPLTDVDTGALLEGMLESYPEFQASRADIRVEGKLPVVLGNEAGLTQCFSNLLGNAVKFVRPGEKAKIRVWAEEREGWARIWVEDKGIGISKEMLPRVFEMFSRGGGGYEGTGIGLALVRKVTQRMGGRAGVESEVGKGSRFWIELKLGEVRTQPGRVETAPPEAKGGTVLYVEDEESDAMFMGRAFAGLGLGSALRVVSDGRAAIEYLSGAGKYADRKEYPLPSLVLLDLNLPQVGGFEVLKWMRNHPDFGRTPVVIFSSSTREDDRVKAKELRADEFVTKPSSGLKFGEVVEGLRGKWMGGPKRLRVEG